MTNIKARLETAQHILHHILLNQYQAQQCGMQIQEDKIRIDVKCQQDLTKIPLAEFEDQVNEIINRNLPVNKQLLEREQVPSNINISFVPPSVRQIRIVSIGDFDIQPCGNAHVDNTSEIGRYKLLVIKKKGKDTYRFEGEVKE